MKNLLLVLMLLAFIGVSTSSFTDSMTTPTPVPQAVAPIVVPIEVMGENGTIVSIEIDANKAIRPDRLYLKAHSISYPAYLKYGTNKASIRLNDGKWIDIHNKTANCGYPEKKIGCINAPYATIRFSIPLKALGKIKDGKNRLAFRFNYEQGDISSGYRILELDLLNKVGVSGLLNKVSEEDPSQWVPAVTDSLRIQNGRQLYEARETLRSFPEGTTMRASCRDCHANNGKDLRYFNYSDHAIITRSTFHGLTKEQGEDIAAWIRSQPLLNEEEKEYQAPGRPWNPPYQPGPSLDSKAVHDWAAGAGLEWVLDTDAMAFQHLVQNGLEAAIDIDSTLNRRELPISMQLADWNDWLPVVHPLDTWGPFFDNSRLYNNYTKEIDFHLRNPESAYVLADELKVVPVVEKYYKDIVDFARYDGGGAVPDGLNRDEMGEAITSLYKWHLVKVWDFVHANHFEDLTKRLYPQGEERGWFSLAQSLSSVAPGEGEGKNEYLDEVSQAYYNTVWSELQVIINSGHRETAGNKPVDWASHFNYIREWKKVTGVSHGTRYLAAYIKVMQNANNRHGVKMPDGFYLGHTSLAWVYELGMPDSKENVFYDRELFDDGLRKELAEAFLRQMLKKLHKHDYNEWDRSLGQAGIGPSSYVPTSIRGNQKKAFTFDNIVYADHFFRIIPLYKDLGVDEKLLHELAQWGRGAWPQGDWQGLISD